MRSHAFRNLPAILIVVVQLFAVSAQAQSYNPFFVSSSGTNSRNLYLAEQGLLMLPFIDVISGDNDRELLFNVVLRHRGGTSFELESVDELLPEQECTRAEVSAAIPRLDLALTVAEAEALIGCSAALQYGQTDLLRGRQAFANWTGNEGMPNNLYGSYVGGYIAAGSTTWIGGTSNRVFSAGIMGAPSISFTLWENLLESISYSLGEQPVICDSESLLEGFRTVRSGDAYTSMVAALACEGNLVRVTVDRSGQQREYTWYSSSPEPATSLALYSQSQSETVHATVMNNRVQQLSYSSNRRVTSDTACAVEDLVTAESEVEVGQLTTGLSGLLDCGTRSETVSINSLAERTSYGWQTSIPSESPFYSVNRSLFVAVDNGMVSSVRLSRH